MYCYMAQHSYVPLHVLSLRRDSPPKSSLTFSVRPRSSVGRGMAQHSYVPLHVLSLRRDSPPKSSLTFSVRPRSSVGRGMVDLIRRSWVRFPPRSKDFFFTLCGSLIPFTRANAQWVIHGFNLALKFTLQS